MLHKPAACFGIPICRQCWLCKAAPEPPTSQSSLWSLSSPLPKGIHLGVGIFTYLEVFSALACTDFLDCLFVGLFIVQLGWQFSPTSTIPNGKRLHSVLFQEHFWRGWLCISHGLSIMTFSFYRLLSAFQVAAVCLPWKYLWRLEENGSCLVPGTCSLPVGLVIVQANAAPDRWSQAGHGSQKNESLDEFALCDPTFRCQVPESNGTAQDW